MITYVYAQDERGGIGYQNDLPWHIPAELKFFKETTMGHPIVMGRRTFDSMDRRLLPGRQTVVITRQEDFGKDIEGLIVLHSIDELLNYAKDQEVMVIGGAQLFNDLLPHADRIIRTVIHEEFPADTFMEPLNKDEWSLTKTAPGHKDEKNPYDYEYQWWKRK